MTLPTVIDWLRQHLNAPWLVVDDDGSSTVHFDTLSLCLVPYDLPPGFSLRARLGNAAEGDFTATLESLLQANLFSDGIGASVLGMDAGGNVFLTRRFYFEPLKREAFLPAFDRFLGQSMQWHTRLPACTPVEAAHG